MSDPRPQIVQDLLGELDRLLGQPFTPWRLYQQWQGQRQLMQRVRDVLSLWPTTSVPPFEQSNALAGSPPPEPPITDIQSQLLAPLQADLQQLLQQRQALRVEVERLESQRSQQQAQIMQPLIAQVEQLELFQQRADQVLRGVDGALQFTFQAFDQDMEAYRRSLTQRFSQLEDLGQQSEVVVSTLLQPLIQELQQLHQKSLHAATIAPPERISGPTTDLLPSTSGGMLPEDRPTPSQLDRPASLLSPISESSVHGTVELARAPAQPIKCLSEVLVLLELIAAAPESTSLPADNEFVLSDIADLFGPDVASEAAASD
ncbi:hypothetical protein IQ266_18545 [filamentous cyanobacterium LEGE 11480]|uniref:Uncharacterized protein n=1 Tax=Romeriopsis navalis LEGE 11480 TaxID=2777977 RepID=A0A928VRP8_9CYAN|nr:hypothetical protein [Romeriopsis navalis]MBE9031736.1 hypothetical protein [Romeriopsis navalis LEGE 11480]